MHHQNGANAPTVPTRKHIPRMCTCWWWSADDEDTCKRTSTNTECSVHGESAAQESA